MKDETAGRPTLSPGRARQTEIYVTGVGGTRPRVPVMPAELEAKASRRMSREAAAYIVGGAGTGQTMRANRAAFDRIELAPRVLEHVASRDLSVELFGRRHRAPLLLAPIGVLDMAHRQADLAVARAAAAENVGMIFSNQASVPMEECAAVMGDVPRWFQLYWSSDDDFVRSLVGRAEACGCEAIVLTLDTTLLGWRPRDLGLGYLPFLRGLGLAQYLTDPVFRERIPASPPETGFRPRGVGIMGTVLSLRRAGKRFDLPLQRMRAAVAHFTATYSRPDLNWNDIARLRDMTRLPIVLKGVRRPDDAAKALDHGVDALVVSNHGGRQVDGEAGTMDVLPDIVRAAGDMPVLLDSGVRSGADIAKALALGARAVLLGRPFVYGLALAGETGVREVIRNIVAEFDLTLALCGLTRAQDLSMDALRA
ncbi:MAG: alpha-hydroxy-acid oxidizing protein [Rhizobiaceae bacterium]|nr:alpha-hydroxy-acid oxidizing protein [Rhizobiaceae bacterium]MCV0407159.1 alpha-hydroxy-acid oxidizing protein [Rhizobiaceae bacterium]